MLQYRGHPYFDIGVATIAAFVGKRNPQILTEQDLSMVADYIAREYVRQPLRSFLTVVFPNSGFTQPAFFNQPDKQLKYIQSVLWGFREETSTTTERCIFTGKPAVGLSFDVKDELPLGRAFRQHVPLLTGEDVINFHPYGDAGLPVSGEAMLAIQAFPLGCAKSAGRLLVVHSDNPDITYHFARTFLAQNRRAVQLAQAADSSKMPEPLLKHCTLLIETLLEAEEIRLDERETEQPFSVTAYHFSNSGQGPSLDIYHLPMEVVIFVREMETARYRQPWRSIVARAWEVESKTKSTKDKSKEPFQPARNWLYEDLFELPKNASKFIRNYFLRAVIRSAHDEGQPQPEYSLRQDANLVFWKITEQFLRRILNMDQQQIEQIRDIGDQLAIYIKKENDRHFFGNFRCKGYHEFRTNLLRVNLNQLKRGRAPIIRFDPYIQVFEHAEGDVRVDWRLARDLVFIRLMERLHELKWLEKDIVEEVVDNVDEDSVDVQ